MSESSAFQPIEIRPVPTDDEAAAIVAAVLANLNLQAHPPIESTAAPEPVRWSRAGRRELTRSFERTRDEW